MSEATPPIDPASTIAGAGPKVLLMGDSGTGKTHALRSLPALGITPFVIATEQNFITTMRDMLGKQVHYKYIPPQAEGSWGDIQDMLSKVNLLSYENLTKTVDPFKQKSNKLIDVVVACNKFVCDCCKRDWGSVSSWSTDRAICIDSCTGLSDMAFSLVVGNKPVRAMPDYQVAQNAMRMLLGPLTTQTRAMFVLVAHLSREKDELTGGTNIVPLTNVGQKLGPDLPRSFSDVIRTRREGTKFSWDTADTQATVTARHVPIAQGMPADFKVLIDTWKAKGGVITPSS